MSVGNPIMCIECGYLHGHHAVSCERQMTGSEAWREVRTIIDVIVAQAPWWERGRLRSRLLAIAHARAKASPLCKEYERAMHKAGYNIR